MTQRSRLMIYERKEVVLLVVLSLLVALFAFTFGVHLGKRVPPKGRASAPMGTEVGSVRQLPDQAPTRAEAQEKAADAPAAVSQALDDTLKEEVAASGIQLDKPVEVDLPSKTKAEKKSKTANQSEKIPEISNVNSSKTVASQAGLESAVHRSAPAGAFTLQILSAPVAETRRLSRALDEFSKAGVEPWVRRAELPGKGSWYRIYHGGFPSSEAAEKVASGLKASGKISGFVVVKMPTSVETISKESEEVNGPAGLEGDLDE
ncbi:MAG: SPOR domain-containing protein [Bdellovibrionales bacterium]|nr:SPOR domain-containing protein [Bdellovibrionales bacterium]